MEVLNIILKSVSRKKNKEKKQQFRGPKSILVQISYGEVNNGTLISLQVTSYKIMAMHILLH